MNGDKNDIDEKNEKRIGTRYILYKDKKLGKGAFGEIYKGRSLKNDTEIAIKCVKNK